MKRSVGVGRATKGKVSPRRCGAALATVAGLVLVPAATAGATNCVSLGSASNYGEYTAGTTGLSAENVAGASAFGGIAAISSSILATSSAATSAPSGITLVLGGASNNVSTSTLANGAAAYSGTFTGSFNTGTFNLVSSLPISFSTADASLTSASSTIGALAPTDIATGSSALVLTSTGTGTDVFSLTESQLSSASTIKITAPSSAVVVVNITGTGALTLSNHQSVTLVGVTAPDVIWNIASASSTSLSSVTWLGTLLVPSGSLTMSANNITGSVLAGGASASFSSDLVNLALFTGCIATGPPPVTPEVPQSIFLPLAGIVVVGGAGVLVRRRRRRTLHFG